MKLILALTSLCFISGCATGDNWDDNHMLARFESERTTASLKREECEMTLGELWINFNGKTRFDLNEKEKTIISKNCAKKIPMPQAPAACGFQNGSEEK